MRPFFSSLFAGAAIALLAACGEAGSQEAASGPAASDVSQSTETAIPGLSSGPALGEMAKGSADAPVEVVEYASWTCGGCYQFHQDVVPTIEEFVDAGKVRFVFREFPTSPARVSLAGFVLARCAGEDRYFDVVDDMFENQPGLIAAIQANETRTALEAVMSRHGVEGEAFEACLQNTVIQERIAEIVAEGDAKGVRSTPTVFIDGEMQDTAEHRTADGMRAILNAKLEAADEAPLPAASSQGGAQ